MATPVRGVGRIERANDRGLTVEWPPVPAAWSASPEDRGGRGRVDSRNDGCPHQLSGHGRAGSRNHGCLYQFSGHGRAGSRNHGSLHQFSGSGGAGTRNNGRRG
jgi:hypothetical protein